MKTENFVLGTSIGDLSHEGSCRISSDLGRAPLVKECGQTRVIARMGDNAQGAIVAMLVKPLLGGGTGRALRAIGKLARELESGVNGACA
ncbi:hypothetical protein HMPREF2946_06430 [Actinomyces sp. HMSC062G12]|nr:hypothetical protein HMPREF2946_06430 [Actinomyces sp. HMSC062G12]